MTSLSATTFPNHAGAQRLSLSFAAIGPAMAVVDVLVVLLAGQAATVAYHGFEPNHPIDATRFLGIGLLAAGLLIPVLYICGSYRVDRITDLGWQSRTVPSVLAGVVGFLTLCAFALKVGQDFSRVTMLGCAALSLLGLMLGRLGWRAYLEPAIRRGAIRMRRVAIISDGSSFTAGDLARDLKRGGYDIARHIALRSTAKTPDRATVEELVSSLRGTDLDEIVIFLPLRDVPFALELSKSLRSLPFPSRLVLDPVSSEIARRRTSTVGGLLSVELERAPMSIFERSAKRMVDTALAAVALVVLAPLMAVVAVAIRLESRGPVIFRQTRHGFNNRPFFIFKFRSMTVMEDGSAVTQATRNDARVTRIGRFIRRTSIDELPQLWNVLRGEMSLVGPRPHAAAHDAFYEQQLVGYPFRQHVKPGLTGWAQVNGSRGETPTVASMARRVELDVWYVRNRSLRLDFRIMLLTALRLVRDADAY